MADTTTTNYGLTKPEVGASEDTWGTKLNANLDTIDGQLKTNADAAAAAQASANTALAKDPVLTLAGDATGSATFTNLGNATLTVAVVNDSHTHDGRYYTESEMGTQGTSNTTAGAYKVGVYSTELANSASTNVQDVLDDLDAAISTVAGKDPVITLAGDLTGSVTLTNLGNGTLTAAVVDDSHNHVISNVDGLQTALDGKSATSHNHTLDSLSNTTITSVASGEILKWNGSAWINNTLAEAGIQASGSYLTTSTSFGGDVSGTYNAIVVADNSHTHNASTIDDNSIGAAELNVSGNGTTAQYLRSDGDGSFTWATPTDTNTTYSAGTGLDLSGTTFSIEPDLRDAITHVGYDSGDYIYFAVNSYHQHVVNGTERLRVDTSGIDVSGRIVADADITAYSDSRIKTNLEVIPDALDKVSSLTGYTYDRTDIDLRQTGLIAQDVLEVLPEAVRVPENEEEMLSLNYGSLMGLMVESIKELKARIEELEAK